MRRKKQADTEAIDDARLLADAGSSDEEVRGEAVRSLCPCHAGWEAFEHHVGVVLGALRDRSRGVRAQALHVFDDAARMQHSGELDYDLSEAEESLRRKRPSRFRPEEGRLEERHRREISWRGGRAGRRG